MLITITGLKYISGAQMRLIQSKNGLFLNDDTLVLEVSPGDVETAEWMSVMPREQVRRTSEFEATAWLEAQAQRWADFEERWETRRTGEPMPEAAIARIRQGFEDLKVWNKRYAKIEQMLLRPDDSPEPTEN